MLQVSFADYILQSTIRTTGIAFSVHSSITQLIDKSLSRYVGRVGSEDSSAVFADFLSIPHASACGGGGVPGALAGTQ